MEPSSQAGWTNYGSRKLPVGRHYAQTTTADRFPAPRICPAISGISMPPLQPRCAVCTPRCKSSLPLPCMRACEVQRIYRKHLHMRGTLLIF